MSTVELRPGLIVRVRNDDGGSFVGRVGDVSRHAAVIVPESPPLRRWYPKHYTIGRAHWDGYVELMDA